MAKLSKSLERIWLIILLAVPIVLWILPGDFFDSGTVDLCPSKLFFDFECLGCGITRAVMHFHNFQYSDALFYNYGVVIVYPILIMMWLIFVKASLQNLGLKQAKYIPILTNRDWKERRNNKEKHST